MIFRVTAKLERRLLQDLEFTRVSDPMHRFLGRRRFRCCHLNVSFTKLEKYVG